MFRKIYLFVLSFLCFQPTFASDDEKIEVRSPKSEVRRIQIENAHDRFYSFEPVQRQFLYYNQAICYVSQNNSSHPLYKYGIALLQDVRTDQKATMHSRIVACKLLIDENKKTLKPSLYFLKKRYILQDIIQAMDDHFEFDGDYLKNVQTQISMPVTIDSYLDQTEYDHILPLTQKFIKDQTDLMWDFLDTEYNTIEDKKEFDNQNYRVAERLIRLKNIDRINTDTVYKTIYKIAGWLFYGVGLIKPHYMGAHHYYEMIVNNPLMTFEQKKPAFIMLKNIEAHYQSIESKLF